MFGRRPEGLGYGPTISQVGKIAVDAQFGIRQGKGRGFGADVFGDHLKRCSGMPKNDVSPVIGTLAIARAPFRRHGGNNQVLPIMGGVKETDIEIDATNALNGTAGGGPACFKIVTGNKTINEIYDRI